MSSDESENDEDYVPSENGSVHSDSDSDSEGEEVDGGGSAAKKKRKNGQEAEAEVAVEKNGDGREKTEDELWNEFLGIDSSGPSTQTASKAISENRAEKNEKETPYQSSDSNSTVSSTSVTAVAADSSNVSCDEPKNLFEDESPADSNCRSVAEKPGSINEQPSQSTTQSTSSASKKPAGVSSLLERIAKDKKLTTLEKSRNDWEGYKSKEGISEELSTHNRGKGGYLNKKEFLERSDYRQFEKERDVRLSKKRKSALD